MRRADCEEGHGGAVPLQGEDGARSLVARYWGVRVMSSKAMEKPELLAFLLATVNLKE
jgi:hypothetical protein